MEIRGKREKYNGKYEHTTDKIKITIIWAYVYDVKPGDYFYETTDDRKSFNKRA